MNLELIREELLDDTVKYYSKPKKRCIDNFGNCIYSGATLDYSTKGCAVGRLVSPELRLKLDTVGGVVDDIFYLLPKKIKKYGASFLRDLQGLHDVPNYWDGSKLTQDGVNFVNVIKEKIKSGYYDKNEQF